MASNGMGKTAGKGVGGGRKSAPWGAASGQDAGTGISNLPLAMQKMMLEKRKGAKGEGYGLGGNGVELGSRVGACSGVGVGVGVGVGSWVGAGSGGGGGGGLGFGVGVGVGSPSGLMSGVRSLEGGLGASGGGVVPHMYGRHYGLGGAGATSGLGAATGLSTLVRPPTPRESIVIPTLVDTSGGFGFGRVNAMVGKGAGGGGVGAAGRQLGGGLGIGGVMPLALGGSGTTDCMFGMGCLDAWCPLQHPQRMKASDVGLVGGLDPGVFAGRLTNMEGAEELTGQAAQGSVNWAAANEGHGVSDSAEAGTVDI